LQFSFYEKEKIFLTVIPFIGNQKEGDRLPEGCEALEAQALELYMWLI
jgi:hypothetical protein